MKKIEILKNLKDNEIPEELKYKHYFNFDKHHFEHSVLFEKFNNVVNVVHEIGSYTKSWLKNNIDNKISETKANKINVEEIHNFGNFEVYVEENVLFKPSLIVGSNISGHTHRIYMESGAKIIDANIFLDKGDIYIGKDTVIEPSVCLKSPVIIGERNEIRSGAYFRGDVIIGDDGIYRGELKNVIMMNKAIFPHPSYVGDSICGYNTHFGNQATTANLGIFAGINDKNNRKNIVLNINEKCFDIGKYKLGIILGDFSQIGCNAVSDPAVFLAPYTIVYALTRIQKGFYGPHEILKNKVFEKGIIERVSLKI